MDHVIGRALDSGRVRWPSGDEPNPFVRYRDLFHSYHVGRAHGMRGADYVELVDRLDKAVAEVYGHGFEITPFFRSEPLGQRLGFDGPGGVWIKDETGNVSGSHKARHLMGLAIHLEVVEQVGLASEGGVRPLAIASCGNAALAAAVVARAMKRKLDVFVPTWAEPPVIEKLEDLGARITVCPREEGVSGDPTYHRLQEAIGDGAIPFTCQGPDNGLTIEGGKTIAYEIASQVRASGDELDSIFIQVGGGALASAVIQGLNEAVELGALERMPQVFTVQTEGGHPLKRAYDRLLRKVESSNDVQRELEYARTHRSEFMWPWEEEPKSIATGILDDETYDWYAVVRGMVETGGRPIVVSEEQLRKANELARPASGIDADHTGTAGLAGILATGSHGDQRGAVLFTGTRRGS